MKTFRRDKLWRLAEKGKLVLVESYHFDDMYGATQTKKEMPVKVLSPGGSREVGVCYVSKYEFEGYGRAWENPNGTVTLYVHSNWTCNYDFRVLP